MEFQNVTRQSPTAELVAMSLTNSSHLATTILRREIDPHGHLPPPAVNENPLNPPDNLGQTTPSEQTATTTVSPHNSGPTLTIGELHVFSASIEHLRHELNAIKNDPDVKL